MLSDDTVYNGKPHAIQKHWPSVRDPPTFNTGIY